MGTSHRVRIGLWKPGGGGGVKVGGDKGVRSVEVLWVC